MNQDIKLFVTRTVLPALMLTGAVLCAAVPVGCKTSVEGAFFLSGDFSVPELREVRVTAADSVRLDFSKRVHVHEARLTGAEESLAVQAAYEDDGRRVVLSTPQEMRIGEPYALELEVEDVAGNTSLLTASFKGFNDHPALLALSELRIKNKNVKADPGQNRAEFVELYALTGGNLSGLELVNAADGETAKYEFPAVEVKAGEYIVVHYNDALSGSVDELDGNLAQATAADCTRTARDLFVHGDAVARLGTADIVLLRNGNTGVVMDAFLYAPAAREDWPKGFDAFVREASAGARWQDAGGNADCAVAGAYDATKLNKETHSVCRRGVAQLAGALTETGALPAGSAAQWYEAAGFANQSPGAANR